MKLALLTLFAAALTAHAAQPRLKTLKVSWDAYVVQPGCSNVVVVVYKSTSLGTVWTPFKPTAYTPANRTNVNVSVIAPGKYRWYATIQGKPLAESSPSNCVTNSVAP